MSIFKPLVTNFNLYRTFHTLDAVREFFFFVFSKEIILPNFSWPVFPLVKIASVSGQILFITKEQTANAILSYMCTDKFP